ncbi:MAG TPA: carboxypeptidase-like regulatory domain-containing protein [Candidatus Hydrogenedentes bacterium]|nr:carboxypeptidase-like regulatory domain-containing protein [Candidatus Hydrogenedentota bacterium]HOL77896.1 carboxypeptidase-like regulatory domain-containing protein [Candidatus Hydrogenedentota bacterium]HPO87134.1 carboxypeptidase-like regulatory domain-containing protein [Candidatus Hydrogenedentota bacterium]
MSVFVHVAAVSLILISGAEITGKVVDETGKPVTGAQVFLEPSLTQPVLAINSAEDGTFRFSNTPEGQMGVFAISPGTAFGGSTVSIGFEEPEVSLTLILKQPAMLHVTIRDTSGSPVSGARIERVALLGSEKVGIPLGKLGSYGFSEPTSDSSGNVEVRGLPEGQKVALKIIHPSYAPTVVESAEVGTSLQVTMETGTIVQGTVKSRGTDSPVANAVVMIRSDMPPYDTVTTTTNFQGKFVTQLRPGIYACRVDSDEMRSPGWEKFSVLGSTGAQDVVLYVVRSGYVHGRVLDASTKAPVAGARIALRSMDKPSDMAKTGSTGGYKLRAVEGENLVELVSAPGYQLPRSRVIKVHVSASEDIELPTFWLVKNPSISISAITSAGEPVPGAVVTLLRPAQLGLQRGNADGRVSVDVAAIPTDGIIVGLVQHPREKLGAVFQVDAGTSREYPVTLKPYGAVSGTVVNKKGKPIPGAIVFGVLKSVSATEPIILWRTLSRTDGVFCWEWCPTDIAVECKASDGKNVQTAAVVLNVEAERMNNAGKMMLDTTQRMTSVYGEAFPWKALQQADGSAVGSFGLKNPTLVMYCPPQEVAIIGSVLETLRGESFLSCNSVIVSEGSVAPSVTTIPVFVGDRPSLAGTYLINKDGVTCLETFGIPPLAALKEVCETVRE